VGVEGGRRGEGGGFVGMKRCEVRRGRGQGEGLVGVEGGRG
jgi:hypothetical protein